MKTVCLVCLFVLLIFPAQELRADKFSNLLETLIKKPLRAAKDLDRPLLRNIDAGKSVAGSDVPGDELLRQFNRLEGVDDEFRTAFKKLSRSEKEALVALVSAGQRVARSRDPNEAIKLIRELDADGLMQGRTYGEFVYDGVAKMGSDYKAVIAKMGAGAGVFFNKVIDPHWKKWTAAGLTAAYLSAPGKFHDALGNLTEYAIKNLTEAGIRIGEATTGGVTNEIIARVKANPVFSILTLAILVFFLLLQIPLFRYFLTRKLLKPLWTVPKDEPAPSAFKGTGIKSRSGYEE